MPKKPGKRRHPLERTASTKSKPLAKAKPAAARLKKGVTRTKAAPQSTPKKSQTQITMEDASDAASEFERALSGVDRAENYVLRLYITGSTPRSAAAISNIRKLCDEYLKGHYDLEVIDIYQQPVLASGDQIIAAPTLIKRLPFPLRKMVGDFSDEQKVLMGLDLRQASQSRIKE